MQSLQNEIESLKTQLKLERQNSKESEWKINELKTEVDGLYEICQEYSDHFEILNQDYASLNAKYEVLQK